MMNTLDKKLKDRRKLISHYGEAFVKKIKQGEKDIKAGRVIRIIDVRNIWESILLDSYTDR